MGPRVIPTGPTPMSQVAYDLLPVDPAVGYCHGASCRRAVDALDAHRQFLHVLTPFRTALRRSSQHAFAALLLVMRWTSRCRDSKP